MTNKEKFLEKTQIVLDIFVGILYTFNIILGIFEKEFGLVFLQLICFYLYVIARKGEFTIYIPKFILKMFKKGDKENGKK